MESLTKGAEMIKEKSLFVTLLLFISTLFSLAHAKQSDLVVFSFNRPLQLYSLLESVDKHVSGIKDIYVIYRAGNTEYASAYEEVKKDFPFVYYLKQSEQPRRDFKPLTLRATFNSLSEYVLFAVDDIIVKDKINLSKDIDLLEKTGAYGFYYRLGKNLNKNYPHNDCAQPLPPLNEVEDKVFAWVIGDGAYDWGYPNTVDMTLYRKSDIQQALRRLNYYNPNTFESNWWGLTSSVRNRIALCYEYSKIVNLPLNRVQKTYQNRSMKNIEISEGGLLQVFNEGKKIDIHSLYHIDNKSSHWPIVPTYIERSIIFSSQILKD